MLLLSHEDRSEVHSSHFNFFARSGQGSPAQEVKPACWYIMMFQGDEQKSPVHSWAMFPGDEAQRAMKRENVSLEGFRVRESTGAGHFAAQGSREGPRGLGSIRETITAFSETLGSKSGPPIRICGCSPNFQGPACRISLFIDRYWLSLWLGTILEVLDKLLKCVMSSLLVLLR